MIHNEEQNLLKDLRFWIVAVFSLTLLFFLIRSYPG